MEELVTLQYGSFTILEEQVKDLPRGLAAQSRWLIGPSEDSSILMNWKRQHPGCNNTQCQE